MAEMFNCEIGYLLCEHPGKTKTATDIMAETGLSETAVDHLREIQKSAGTVYGGAKLMLLNAILEDEEFLENAANALYALHMIPEQTMIEISFYDERGKHNGNSLRSDSSDDLKRLYVADLQNIIFRFMESQLHI